MGGGGGDGCSGGAAEAVISGCIDWRRACALVLHRGPLLKEERAAVLALQLEPCAHLRYQFTW